MKKILLSALFFCITLLGFAQSRSALIHLKSGEVKEFDVANIDSITFTDAVTYDKQLTATQSLGIYYGGGQYLVELSDQPISSNGLPTQAGQVIVRFIAFGVDDADSRNAKLPSGRYTPATTFAPGTLYNSSSSLQAMVCTGLDSVGAPLGYTIPFDKTAVANVEYKSDGTYAIDFKGQCSSKLDGAAFQNIHVTYDGAISFDNQDPKSYELLDKDVVMVPTGSAIGYSNVAGSYGDYSCTFYNTPLDDEKFVIGAGELMNLELLTPEAQPMDLSKLAGTYTVTSALEGPWAPGNWLDGQLYEYYGIYMPLGTYYSTYDANGNKTNMNGFARSGSVVVTVEGDDVTFNCDLVAEGGHTIKMNYTVNKSAFVDQSASSGAPVANKSSKKNSFGRLTAPVNVRAHQSALRLVKQQ